MKTTIFLYFCKQGSEDGLKEKNEIIARLEEKTNKITAAMRQLEQRYSTSNLSFFFPPFFLFFCLFGSDTCHRSRWDYINQSMFSVEAQQEFAFCFGCCMESSCLLIGSCHPFFFFRKSLRSAVLCGATYCIKQIHKQKTLKKLKMNKTHDGIIPD